MWMAVKLGWVRADAEDRKGFRLFREVYGREWERARILIRLRI